MFMCKMTEKKRIEVSRFAAARAKMEDRWRLFEEEDGVIYQERELCFGGISGCVCPRILKKSSRR